MITCYLRYVIDPYKLVEFEKYGRCGFRWLTNSEALTMDIFCLMRERTTLQ